MNRVTNWSRKLRAWLRGRGDRGSFELFYAVIALVGFLIIGLVIDGGRALNSRSHAAYMAQEAARAGAQEIDPAQAIPGDRIAVDPQAARRAASSYLEREGLTGTVDVDGGGNALHVEVSETHGTIFASLLGTSSITVTGDGSATLLHQPDASGG